MDIKHKRKTLYYCESAKHRKLLFGCGKKKLSKYDAEALVVVFLYIF